MSLVQGTLMAQRSVVGPYPDRRRGEDTPALMALVSAGRRVAALQDMGYLYVYRFHGLNAWDERHHRAISAAKARSGPVLEEGRAVLEEHLRAYPVPQRVVSLVDGTRRVPLILGSPNTGQSMGL